MFVLNCSSLNFKCILETLHLYSLPVTITVFDIIFYILTVFCIRQLFTVDANDFTTSVF